MSFRDTIEQIRKILPNDNGCFVQDMEINQLLVDIENSFVKSNYNKGYNEGYRAGYKKGYADGEESKK